MRVALARGCPALAPGALLNQNTRHAAGLESFFSIGDPDQPSAYWLSASPSRGSLEMEEQDFSARLAGTGGERDRQRAGA